MIYRKERAVMNVSTIEQIRSEIANEVIEMERERDRLYQYV